MRKYIVEGEKLDSGYKPGCNDEFCPHCENEAYNIPSDRISLCPHCEEELFPCAGCEDDDRCDYSEDTKSCHRFAHTVKSLRRRTMMEDIKNPVEEIIKAIPQLSEPSRQKDLVYLSRQNWHNRLKTIETKNLKKYRRSKTASSMSSYFHPCIIEFRDEDTVVIDSKKYKLIRDHLMSEKFNLKKQ